MAEAARLAAPGRAGDAAGGVVIGPSVLGLMVGALGSYALAFALLAMLPATGAALALRQTHPKQM